jgi:hypothetical protein
MNEHENRPRVELSTILPVGIGAVSLFGICLLLVASRLSVGRSTVQVPDTATPFHYLLVGTEPGISSAIPFTEEGTPGEILEPGSAESTPEPELSITSTPRLGFAITAQSGVSSNNGSPSNVTQRAPTNLSTDDPVIIMPGTKKATLTVGAPLPTRTATPTFVPTPTYTPQGLTKTPVTMQTIFAPASPTRTPTSASSAPLNAGTYDDNDSRILYIGNWTSQTNVGNAYQNTLHVSTTLGNSITFRFIGQELRLFYLSGSSLGAIRITIDQKSFDLLEESEFTSPSEWVSDYYPAGGTHTVTIEHLNGGSVNLDQVIIPDLVPTATGS